MKWDEINPMVRRAGHIIKKNTPKSSPRKIYDYALYFCRRGQAQVDFPRERLILEEGMFLLIPPDTCHTISYEGADFFGLLWCHFDFTARDDQDELDRFVRSSYSVCLKPILPRRELIRPSLSLPGALPLPLLKRSLDLNRDFDRMSALVTAFIKGEEDWKLICKIHLLPLLYFLLKGDAPVIAAGEEKNSVIGELKRYLEDHYDQPLTLKLLSDLFNYHEDYLGRLFRDKTGIGFRDYLNRLRVEKSLEMLSAGAGLEEIAGLTGFCDAFYYSKVFKKIKGESPSRWREKQL